MYSIYSRRGHATRSLEAADVIEVRRKSATTVRFCRVSTLGETVRKLPRPGHLHATSIGPLPLMSDIWFSYI